MADKKGWERLCTRRDAAKRHPLRILVWVPAKGGDLEFQKRLEIRDTLRRENHYAEFSEDLVPKDGSANDPFDEELLQADEADFIVVLYGSRGTQTEVDRILSH